MSNRPSNTRPARGSGERYDPYARPKPSSPVMLPDSFGPEGEEQLLHMCRTAHENPHLDLDNIPDIGRGIPTSKWVATQAAPDSGTGSQRSDTFRNRSLPPPFPQRLPPQYDGGNDINPSAFAPHHPPQFNTGPPSFHAPERHSQFPYDQYGPSVVENPVRRGPTTKQPTRKTLTHREDPRGKSKINEETNSQEPVPQNMPRGGLQVIREGLPSPAYYTNPSGQRPQEVILHNSFIRAPPLPRFHNVPGMLPRIMSAENARPYPPNHGYAEPRHYMGNPAPAPAFQIPRPIGSGPYPNPPYQITNGNDFGVLDPRRNIHGGQVHMDPRRQGPSYYNPHSDREPRSGASAEVHDHLQRTNPSMSNAAITQDGRSQMKGPLSPMGQYANSGGNRHPPFGRPAVEYQDQNNSRPAHGMASSMTHVNDPHRHLNSRETTPSVNGSHSSESRALVLRDDQSQISAGALMCIGTSFRASRMKMESNGLIPTPQARHDSGSRYLGDPTSKSYLSQVIGLSDELNCALWITKLHPNVDLPGFLNMVRTGAVYACTLNDPEKAWTKAAKLVFKTHEGAAAFLAKVDAGIKIEDTVIKAVWNRVGYRANTTNMTRCLHIRAASDFHIKGNLVMNQQFWTAYFSQCVVYELEGFREWHKDGTSVVEARFARIDGQAEALWHAIQKDPYLFGVQVWYAPDPCDPNSGFK